MAWLPRLLLRGMTRLLTQLTHVTSGELGNAYGAYREGMLLVEGTEEELPPSVCSAAAEAFKVRPSLPPPLPPCM